MGTSKPNWKSVQPLFISQYQSHDACWRKLQEYQDETSLPPKPIPAFSHLVKRRFNCPCVDPCICNQLDYRYCALPSFAFPKSIANALMSFASQSGYGKKRSLIFEQAPPPKARK